jgi:hypothetical protein
LKHGVFTHHLLSGWRDGEAGDDDGKIYLFGLTNFITKRFAEKVQNPQIMIRGGTPLVLGYHQKIVSPSEQNQPHPPLSPCKMIPEHDPILHDSQTNVYIQPVLPGPFTLEQIHKRRQIRLAMLIFLLFLILAIGMALITHC